MSERRGILLCGGTGSRLYPLTGQLNKHLLPVYNKPMLYYPLTSLMLAGVREILVVSSPEALPLIRAMLGDGEAWGLTLAYAEQSAPRGLPEALTIGERFLDGRPSALILGDNVFFGNGLTDRFTAAAEGDAGATIFVHPVRDPERYGILETAPDGRPLRLVEKPARPRSNLAVTGFYLYDADAPRRARSLRPSARGELEITELNAGYLAEGRLAVEQLGRGFVWFDVGTPEALQQANSTIETLEHRQGLGIACPEEVALRQGFIDAAGFARALAAMPACAYRGYLESLDPGALAVSAA